MPKDRDSHQRFETSVWKAPTTEPDAGKVYIVGSETNANIPVTPGGTAAFVSFSIIATGWTTLLSAQANTGYEIRIVQFANTGTTKCQFQYGFSSATYVPQGLAAEGGAFNQNFVAGFWRGGDNKAFLINISTATKVAGAIWYKEV